MLMFNSKEKYGIKNINTAQDQIFWEVAFYHCLYLHTTIYLVLLHSNSEFFITFIPYKEHRILSVVLMPFSMIYTSFQTIAFLI